jgi:hypothetical protein
LVAFPVVTLVIAACFGAAFPTSSSHSPIVAMLAGSVAVEDGGIVLADNGGRMVVEEGTAQLDDGTALAVAAGVLRVRAEDAVFTGFGGVFSLAIHGGDVTVAALTSPVLVEDARGIRMVVPPMRQWEYASDDIATPAERVLHLRPLPEEFVHDALARAKNFTVTTALSHTPSVAASLLASMPRLSTAQMRFDTDTLTDRLAALRVATASGDLKTASTLLDDPMLREVIRSNSDDVLIGTLARTDHPGLRILVLPLLLNDPATWMLASFHPALRDLTWFQDAPTGISGDLELLHLFLLPASDILRDSIPNVIREGWEAHLHSVIAASATPASFLDDVVAILTTTIVRAEKDGQPARAQAYDSILQRLASTFHLILSAPALPEQEPLQVAEARTPSVATPTIPADQAISQARAALDAIGILPTVQTQFSYLEPASVRVTTVVFPTPSGDQSVDFVFDASTGLAHDVRVAGQIYPYPVPLPDLRAWMAGEEE